MSEGIRLGSILFTLVEPHRGHAADYNRWYERDHFYAGCMVGPGILAGRRWVATRPYKELRRTTPEIEDDPARGSYLALYWIERAHSRRWGAWAAEEVHRLHGEGRMFPHRDHVHTKMYRYEGGVFRDPDGVPAELALDHPFAGLGVVIGGAEDRAAALEAWREGLPRALAGSAASMALLFAPIPIPDDAPADVPRIPSDERRFLVLTFLERDPLEAWEKVLAAYPAAGTLWAGAFIPTIPGTDAYTDQLW